MSERPTTQTEEVVTSVHQAMKLILPHIAMTTQCAASFLTFATEFEEWLAEYNTQAAPDRQVFLESRDYESNGEDYRRWKQYEEAYRRSYYAIESWGRYSFKQTLGRPITARDKEKWIFREKLHMCWEETWFMMDSHLSFYEEILDVVEELDEWHQPATLRESTLAQIDQTNAAIANVPEPQQHSEYSWDSKAKAYYDSETDQYI